MVISTGGNYWKRGKLLTNQADSVPNTDTQYFVNKNNYGWLIAFIFLLILSFYGLYSMCAIQINKR